MGITAYSAEEGRYHRSQALYEKEDSEHKEARERWESAKRLEIEALTKIIGSRSGENSAAAANSKTYLDPVFRAEQTKLEEAISDLQKGKGAPYKATRYPDEISPNIAMFYQVSIISAVILASASIIGLITRHGMKKPAVG